MATIQVVIDDELLARLDRQLAGHQKKRSAFVRSAISEALQRAEDERDEREWEESYRRQPQDKEELAAWQSVQDWGDPWETPEP